jgi:hypothetical protein
LKPDNIIPVGVDCTLNHGFNDFLGYKIYDENGIRKTPFGATWIYSPDCRKGNFQPTHYGSLSVVSSLIKNNFAGWDQYKKNFRGKTSLKKYPVEFTHYFGTPETENNLNREAVDLFLKTISGSEKITFCSVWRTYRNFAVDRIAKDKNLFQSGISDFRAAVKCDHDLKFFFVIDRDNIPQRHYVSTLMGGNNIRYGILFNEIDTTPGRRWKQRFDCAGWQQALEDTGMRLK